VVVVHMKWLAYTPPPPQRTFFQTDIYKLCGEHLLCGHHTILFWFASVKICSFNQPDGQTRGNGDCTASLWYSV